MMTWLSKERAWHGASKNEIKETNKSNNVQRRSLTQRTKKKKMRKMKENEWVIYRSTKATFKGHKLMTPKVGKLSSKCTSIQIIDEKTWLAGLQAAAVKPIGRGWLIG